MDAGFPEQATWPHPVPLTLSMVAAGGFALALVSLVSAWRIAFAYPPFRKLGIRKWFMGTFVLAYMPDAAMPYVKRYFMGFALFLWASRYFSWRCSASSPSHG